MRNLLLSLLLAAGATLAQIPSAGQGQVVYAQPSAVKAAFLAKHPGAVLIHQDDSSVHFAMPDGTRTAIIGQPGSAADLALVAAPDGYEVSSAPVTVKVLNAWEYTSPTAMATGFEVTAETYKGLRLVTPSADLDHGATFTFEAHGLAWEVELSTHGWELRSDVTKARGPQTYSFAYVVGDSPTAPDADGNLASQDGRWKITRAKMVRADGIETACSAWSIDGSNVSFSCDDSGFPAEAFPYVIDPQYNLLGAYFADSFTVGNSSCTGVWPPNANIYQNSNAWVGNYLEWVSPNYRCHNYTGSFSFATSSIPTAATISSATAAVTCSVALDQGGTYTGINVAYSTATEFGTNYGYTNAQVQATAFAVPWSSISAGSCGSPALANPNTSITKGGGNTYLRAGINPMTYAPYYGKYASFNITSLTVTYTVNSSPVLVSGTIPTTTPQTGVWYNFSATYRDPDGFADLTYQRMLVAYGIDAVSSCYLFYVRAENNVYLFNDAGSGYAGWSALSAAGGIVANSQCDIDTAGSSKVDSGTDSTLTVKIRFKRTFNYNGWTKNFYVHATDSAGVAVGWNQAGASMQLIPVGPRLVLVEQ